MATTRWFVELFYVSSVQKQHEVLETFYGIAGLVAFGASAGSHYIVGFECQDYFRKVAAELLLTGIDPGAVCTYDSTLDPGTT